MVTRRWVLGAAAVAAANLRMNFDARAEETYANKTVFMTSDDGPNAATSIIIDIAERHQVPFTLFMIGTNVAADPDHRKLIERARASEWITTSVTARDITGGAIMMDCRWCLISKGPATSSV